MIVVANPNPSSFAHALADKASSILAEAGYTIAAHDLYREHFDPIQCVGELLGAESTDPIIEQHCSELASADIIVIVHPNWWGQPPAILKGWIDRVFRLGTAYKYAPGVPVEGEPFGLLHANAVIFNTSNTPVERERAVFGDPLELLWRRCIFGLCGVERVERRMFGPISSSDALQRQAWLADAAVVIEASMSPT
jgi:NAD(P)H dehydrogenase (quinone)